MLLAGLPLPVRAHVLNIKFSWLCLCQANYLLPLRLSLPVQENNFFKIDFEGSEISIICIAKGI